MRHLAHGTQAARHGPLLGLLAALAMALVACGGERDPGPDPGAGAGDGPGAGGTAPACDEVEPLPATDGDGREAGAELARQAEAWAQEHAPDDFAGVWLDGGAGPVVVAFAGDVDDHAQAVREAVDASLTVARAEHPLVHLEGVQQRITAQELGGDPDRAGAVRSTGVHMTINRTSLGVLDPDEDRLAELSERYGAEAICFEVEPAPDGPADGVRVLAKAQGWRDGLVGAGSPFALLEIADDEATARLAWEENVPAEADEVDEDLPATPGIHAPFDDVDFDAEAVVVWSSGESGTCPAWLADVATAGGVVHVEVAATSRTCTDDYNPYRLVVAVDRDRLPSVDELPLEVIEGVPDGRVVAYDTGDA